MTTKRSSHSTTFVRAMRLALAAALAIVLLGGCATKATREPKPTVDVPASFKETGEWKNAEPADTVPRGTWWHVFNDSTLDDLASQIDLANQDIKQVEARYRAAQAAVRIARSAEFPTVTGRAAATRSAQGGNQASQYSLGADLDWEIDLWGRVRSSVEAAQANASAASSDIESLKLSSQSTLAQDYFQLRIADAQRKLLDDTVTGYQRSLQLVTNQYNAGVVPRGDVVQAEAQLRGAEASAIDSGVARAQFEHAIALLIGKPASSFSIPAEPVTWAESRVPRIPPGIPSQLLERRPDIAAAERRMASANALIGVARAAVFPALTLSASAGLASSTLANLFSLPSRVWSIGPALAGAIFDAGLRRAQTDQAIANYDEAVGVYRQAILTAFQDVEDNLVAQRLLADEAVVQAAAVAAADQAVQIALNQYRAGTANYLVVITAQTTAYNNRRTALDIQRRRLVAAAGLVKALGGGWD